VAASLRAGLRCVEFPYRWAVNLRNRRYDRRQSEIHRADVPVISVGNLTLGGTGKTPLVEWLARRFQSAGIRVAIVSRGYGAKQGKRNDEALELELALPDVPHVQNPNRVAATQLAINDFGAELILLDDGFQHRRLARDLDIVLLDATEPFGFDSVFPRGTLREPIDGLARAQVVVLSRADMLDLSARHAIRERAAKIAPRAVWCEVVHKPAALLDAKGKEHPLLFPAAQQIAAFCGIGNPAGFRHTLQTLGCQVATWQEFPDHYTYTDADIEALTRWAANADRVLCTRKDLVKLGVTRLGDVPLYAVSVQLQFLTGEAELSKKLDAFSPRAETST